MLTSRTGQADLGPWIDAVRASPLPALHSFANGLEKDRAAMRAPQPGNVGARAELVVLYVAVHAGRVSAGPHKIGREARL